MALSQRSAGLRFFACLPFGFLACAGLPACNDDGGSAEPPFVGVKGSARDVYRVEGGESVAPAEATRWSSIVARAVEAVPAASYPGAMSAEGEIAIPDVPEGPYWLELTSPPPATAPELTPFRTYYELSERSFDVSRLLSYRPDVQSITQPTYLSVNATLSRPWQFGAIDTPGSDEVVLDDALFLYSRNAYVATRTDLFFSAPAPGTPATEAPADGAATLAWTFDAKDAFGRYVGPGNEHLVDGAKGDEMVLLHLVAKAARTAGASPAGGGTDPWRAYTYHSVEGELKAGAFSMTDGGTSEVRGSFAPVPQKTFSLDYKGSAFNDLLRDLPAVELNDSLVSLNVYHEPGAPEPAFGAFVDLLDFTIQHFREPVDPLCNASTEPEICADTTACPNGCNDAETLVLPGDHAYQYGYGNPLAGGQELASIVYTVNGDSNGPPIEGETPERLRAEFSVQAPADELNGKPVAPVVSLPRNVKINGQPTPTDVLSGGVGTTPTVTFDPPSLGTPTYYTIRVIEANDRKNAQGDVISRSRRVATIRSKSNSITLPEGLLQGGKRYYLQVGAHVIDESESLQRFGARSASAVTFTGVFVL
jgi:hypothetical protein